MKIKMEQKIQIGKKKRASYKKTINGDRRQLNTMVIPGFVLTFIFAYLPMVGIILAFKNFNPILGIFGSKWVGFDNFKFFFMSDDFWMLLRNTIGYSLWFLFICNVANIAFAIMCYNVVNKKALKCYQTTAILPTFMSIVLISYIVYIFLSPSTGVVNRVLLAFGFEKIDWYKEPSYWPAILTIVKVWNTVGYGSLLYYATMVGIDEGLFEAAKIDGANKWQQIVHVVIPELSALICLNIIMGIGNALGGDFGLHYQITRNVALLYDTTDIFATYVFKALQEGTSMGRTTAVGLFQSVCGVILILISNGVIKKIDPEKSMF